MKKLVKKIVVKINYPFNCCYIVQAGEYETWQKTALKSMNRICEISISNIFSPLMKVTNKYQHLHENVRFNMAK